MAKEGIKTILQLSECIISFESLIIPAGINKYVGGINMGFRLKSEGGETIELGSNNILTATTKLIRMTPMPDRPKTVRFLGLPVDPDCDRWDQADDTMKIALWSLVPAIKADCYRKATLEVLNAGQVVWKVHFPMPLWWIIPRTSVPMRV